MKRNKSTKKLLLTLGTIDILLLCLIYARLRNLMPVLIGIFVFVAVEYILYILLTSFKNKSSSSENTSQPTQFTSPDILTKIQYNNFTSPSAKIYTTNGAIDYDLEIEYAQLSTSKDGNVCPMCAQFEGKTFLSKDAPKLPLCPNCGCAYLYYFKEDLPADTVISNKKDFVLPAECTSIFYETEQKIHQESDINKLIQLCESESKKLHEFMKPYLSAKFPAPAELACRDLLPHLYMQLGKWKKAENAIKTCITEKAYYPEDGAAELAQFKIYQKVATETLSYLSRHPGFLQKNIYKVMGYEGEEKEQLKYFLRNSKQIEKVRCNNTNQLFCIAEKNEDNKSFL